MTTIAIIIWLSITVAAAFIGFWTGWYSHLDQMTRMDWKRRK